MARTPIVDLTRRGRAPNLVVDVGTGYELLVGLCAWGSPDCRDLLDIGTDWFEQRRTQASTQLGTALDAVRGAGDMFGFLTGLIQAAPGRDTAAVMTFLEATDPGELWLTLVGHYARSHHNAAPAELFLAGTTEPSARRRLAGALAADPETASLSPVAATDPVEAKDRLLDLLHRWHDEVMRDHLEGVAAVLGRDADAKRRMAASLSAERLVEAATNGIAYTPPPEVTGILLVPQVVMRPWVLINERDGLRIFLYPVADESMSSEPEDPPARLVALCKALADPQRLRLLRLLASGPVALQPIADHLGVAKSTAHHHLAALRAAGLVRISLGADKEYELRGDLVPDAAALLGGYLGAGAPPAATGSEGQR